MLKIDLRLYFVIKVLVYLLSISFVLLGLFFTIMFEDDLSQIIVLLLGVICAVLIYFLFKKNVKPLCPNCNNVMSLVNVEKRTSTGNWMTVSKFVCGKCQNLIKEKFDNLL